MKRHLAAVRRVEQTVADARLDADDVCLQSERHPEGAALIDRSTDVGAVVDRHVLRREVEDPRRVGGDSGKGRAGDRQVCQLPAEP